MFCTCSSFLSYSDVNGYPYQGLFVLGGGEGEREGRREGEREGWRERGFAHTYIQRQDETRHDKANQSKRRIRTNTITNTNTRLLPIIALLTKTKTTTKDKDKDPITALLTLCAILLW